MQIRPTLLALTGLLLATGIATQVWAHDTYPSRIPNGKVFSCANCHIDPKGGGSRNAFGKAFGNNKSAWNATLASLDSDGDGFANGFELQDAQGAWRPGRPSPGTVALVANPGNKSSAPPPTVAVDAATWSAIKSLYRDR